MKFIILSALIIGSVAFSESIGQANLFDYQYDYQNNGILDTHQFRGGEGRRGRRIGPAPKHRPDRRKGVEHTKGKRESTKQKHEKGSSRKAQQEKRSE
ncbi:MAG: hypothetical protein KDK71_10445, partial [Chlamydiia bacterium]|nr:hypothetical protein [Chlamydiia bacterium]